MEKRNFLGKVKKCKTSKDGTDGKITADITPLFERDLMPSDDRNVLNKKT